MAAALVTQIAYAVQTLFDPAGTAGRLVDLGKLANYGLLGGSAPTVWLPSELFTSDVNGAWYDPSDFSTLFQDAAGTTPVTAVEQPVGKMLDKSGLGNHAFNPSGNSANFPVLQQDGTGRYYLSFNGVNQWLQTNSIDFTYGDKMFVSAGVRKLTGNSVILESSVIANTNNGSFVLVGDQPVPYKYDFASVGSAVSEAITNNYAYAAPVTNVVSGIGNISGDQAILRVNGTQAAISTADQGTGNYGNYPMFVGARAGTSLWLNGRLYGLVVAGKAASASEITSTESWLNQKTGAF